AHPHLHPRRRARLGALPGDHPDRAPGGPGPQRHEARLRRPRRHRPRPAEVGRLPTGGCAAVAAAHRGDVVEPGRSVMLEITSVGKTFFAGTPNERVALDDITLSLAPCEFTTGIWSYVAGESVPLHNVDACRSPRLGSG